MSGYRFEYLTSSLLLCFGDPIKHESVAVSLLHILGCLMNRLWSYKVASTNELDTLFCKTATAVSEVLNNSNAQINIHLSLCLTQLCLNFLKKSSECDLRTSCTTTIKYLVSQHKNDPNFKSLLLKEDIFSLLHQEFQRAILSKNDISAALGVVLVLLGSQTDFSDLLVENGCFADLTLILYRDVLIEGDESIKKVIHLDWKAKGPEYEKKFAILESAPELTCGIGPLVIVDILDAFTLILAYHPRHIASLLADGLLLALLCVAMVTPDLDTNELSDASWLLYLLIRSAIDYDAENSVQSNSTGGDLVGAGTRPLTLQFLHTPYFMQQLGVLLVDRLIGVDERVHIAKIMMELLRQISFSSSATTHPFESAEVSNPFLDYLYALIGPVLMEEAEEDPETDELKELAAPYENIGIGLPFGSYR